MAIVATDNRHYKDIADAIRARLNGEDKYTPMEMANGVHTVCDYQYYQGRTEGEEVGHANGVEDGKQEAYDTFWDAAQNNGELMEYTYAFYNSSLWNEITFKPKYPLRPKMAAYMFYSNKRIPLLPVEADFSQCGNMSYCFCSTRFQQLPVIDMRKVASTITQQSVFYGCENLTSIEKIYLHGGNYGDSFEKLTSLVEIRTEGEFVSSLNFQWSPLSVMSMKSIISCLKNFTGTDKKFAYTLTFSDECWAALEADSTAPDGGTWKDYVTYTLCWNA